MKALAVGGAVALTFALGIAGGLIYYVMSGDGDGFAVFGLPGLLASMFAGLFTLAAID